MRLTLDLIDHATSFMNPIGERELDLRGNHGTLLLRYFIPYDLANKIPGIENLATTRDRHDTLDLNDNEIRKLENFPLMKRLTSLLLANNFIRKIEPLHTKLPYLHTLILTNNLIEDMKDIEVALKEMKNLKTLSLLGNPIVSKLNYRLFMIKSLPQLLILDFQKISPKVLQRINLKLY